MRYARKIMYGAPDETRRLWLREDESKALLRNSSKGYQTTFFEDEGVWRSSRGYFPLFRHLDGTKGIVFSFNYGGVEVEEINNPSFPGGIRHSFKNAQRIDFVKAWCADEPVKLDDILGVIGTYSSNLRQTIADHAILYETDREKGIFRSGGVAYVMRFEDAAGGQSSSQRRVREIKRYTYPIDTGSLVNPFGETPLERIMQDFDPGEGLLEKQAQQRMHLQNAGGNGSQKLAWDSISEEEAERIIFRDFLIAGRRYLNGLDPATDDDKKFNNRYFLVKRGGQLAVAFLYRSYRRILVTDGVRRRRFELAI